MYKPSVTMDGTGNQQIPTSFQEAADTLCSQGPITLPNHFPNALVGNFRISTFHDPSDRGTRKHSEVGRLTRWASGEGRQSSCRLQQCLPTVTDLRVEGRLGSSKNSVFGNYLWVFEGFC